MSIPAYNPAVPLGLPAQPVEGSLSASKQRRRKAFILAATRSLIIQQGCEHVTMRGIADLAHQAVGTIYNLVGNREEAIAEALIEYTLHVGRMSSPRAEDPKSLTRLVDSWMQSTRATPELCRQLHLLYFSKERDIYYRFQERQLAKLARFLRQQQRSEIIQPQVNVEILSEQMILLICGIHQKWADRPYSLDNLHRKLRDNCSSILLDKVNPQLKSSWTGH